MRFLVVFVLAASIFGAAGCAERRVEVSGTVTYNGLPLDQPGGQIVFVSASGVQVPAAIAADGTFRASNVVVGPNRVAVFYTNSEAKKGAKRFPVKGQPPPEAPAVKVSAFLTPEKYASVETSDLSTNAEEGTVFSPDLKGPEITKGAK